MPKKIDYAAKREQEAIKVGSSKTKLRKRLMEARSVLLPKFRKQFTKQAEFDFENKMLISDDGKLALIWSVRERPDLPISYENQQTTRGSVGLFNLKKEWWKKNNPIESEVEEEEAEVALVYIGDGYLAAAEYSEQVQGPETRYFMNLADEENFKVIYTVLPEDIAEKVVLQGASDQWYGDGYEAAEAVAPYQSDKTLDRIAEWED